MSTVRIQLSSRDYYVTYSSVGQLTTVSNVSNDLLTFACSLETKNTWSFTSNPPYAFTAWCLVKHRDNFTFSSSPREHSHTIRCFNIYNEVPLETLSLLSTSLLLKSRHCISQRIF